MLSAERGASVNTIEAYRRDLKHFAARLAARGVSIEAADGEAVRDYIQGLARAGLAPGTSARRLSSLRQFYRFLFAEGIRRQDATAGIDSPRQGRALPKVLSEAEVDALLAAARAVKGAEGIRLTALVEILYATGLRVSELVTLPLSAVPREAGVLIVLGKGGRERMVPLGAAAIEAERDDLELGAAEPGLEAVERRHLADAGGAPGGPEVEQHDPATKIGEGQRPAAGVGEADVRHGNRRRRLLEAGHGLGRSAGERGGPRRAGRNA